VNGRGGLVSRTLITAITREDGPYRVDPHRALSPVARECIA
jgi:hypothetical protein